MRIASEGRDGRITTTGTIHFARTFRGRKQLRRGAAPPTPLAPALGRVPRVATVQS